MKKKLTQILVLAIALTIGATAFAQTPTTATRQRKATPDGAQAAVTAGRTTTTDSTATGDKEPEKKADTHKDKSKPLAEVTADGQTNRADESSEEAAIVPYYHNFFTTDRLGPEDVVSLPVLDQDRSCQ